MKKKLYYWSSDTRAISGEGILAKKFLKDLSTIFKNYKFISINKFKDNNYNSLYSKYIKQFLGISKIWYFHIKGYKVAYINYLPFWNFLIFSLLPSSTILGPITGTSLNKNFNFKTKVKYFILEKIFYKITMCILFFKWKRLLFSTNMLYYVIPKKFLYKCDFNYVLKNFKLKKIKKDKKKNKKCLIYFRNHPTKYNKNFFLQMKKLTKVYEAASFGDYFKIKNIKNFGKISKKNLLKLMSNYNFTFNGLENLYSLHFLNSINENLKIFCDINLKRFNFHFKSNNIVFIDFNDKKFIAKIKYQLDRKSQKKNINDDLKVEFNHYFGSLK